MNKKDFIPYPAHLIPQSGSLPWMILPERCFASRHRRRTRWF